MKFEIEENGSWKIDNIIVDCEFRHSRHRLEIVHDARRLYALHYRHTIRVFGKTYIGIYCFFPCFNEYRPWIF